LYKTHRVNVNITFFLRESFPQKTPPPMFEGLGQVRSKHFGLHV